MERSCFQGQYPGINVKLFPHTGFAFFENTLREALAAGYTQKSRRDGKNTFAHLEKEGNALFLSYFPGTAETQAVEEEHSNYSQFDGGAPGGNLPATLTQISLRDFGMSYAVRLPDGRFILFDGGRELPPDADELMNVLRAGSPAEKPVIAAWIMTHPHGDHYHCFFPFMESYGAGVTVEKILFNFPAHDDPRFPDLAKDDPRKPDTREALFLPRFSELVKKYAIPVFTPHTGQIFRVGDATLEILASPDEALGEGNSINCLSLVTRMELGGQTILFAADASFESAKLTARWGESLKADILQVPHHGFPSGSPAATIEGYKYIDPAVCLFPVSEINCFTLIDTYREASRYLLCESDVDEVITGDVTRTLTLPYTPSPRAKERIRERYAEGRAACGATAYIFNDLDTGNPEDLVFTFTNVTNADATVYASLYFREKKDTVRFIGIKVPPQRSIELNVTDLSVVDPNPFYFHWLSLTDVGVAENAAFAAHFLSDVPLAISHKTHTASYHN